MSYVLDLHNKTYGRLTVLCKDVKRNNQGLHMWICKCDCGSIISVVGSNLKKGNTQSCGCLRKERSIAAVKIANTKHGHTSRSNGKGYTREYSTWHAMLQRCEDFNCKAFIYYGGRGIKVCERWHEFENFLADMGEKPKGLTIERINNNGNYEPGNCRWATRIEQNRNKKDSINIEYKGSVATIAEWTRYLNLKPTYIYDWLKRGHSFESLMVKLGR